MYNVKLHNALRRKLGLRGNAEKYSNVSASDIDAALEEATIILLENTIQRPEVNGRAREDLRVLKKMNKSLTYEILNDEIIVKLPDQYYRMSNIYFTAKKGSCPLKNISVNFTMDQDYREAKKDPNWGPSYEWASTVAENSDQGVHIAISKDMTVQKVYMDYYIKPVFSIYVDVEEDKPYIDYYGKERLEGVEPTLIENFIWRRIVDIAEVILAKAEMDTQKYQLAVNSITNFETLHTV